MSEAEAERIYPGGPRLIEPAPPKPPPIVERVTEATLEIVLEWAVPVLAKKYPQLSEAGFRSLCHQAIYGGPLLLLRSDHGLLLCEKETSCFEPRPRVREVELVNNGLTKAEVVQLYRAARGWARAIGAIEIKFGEAASAPFVSAKLRIDRTETAHVATIGNRERL